MKLCVYLMTNPVLTAEDIVVPYKESVYKKIVFPERCTHPKLMEKMVDMYLDTFNLRLGRSDSDLHIYTYSRLVMICVQIAVVKGKLDPNLVEIRIPLGDSELEPRHFRVAHINELGILYGDLPEGILGEELELSKKLSRLREARR